MEPSFNDQSTRLSANGRGTPPDPQSSGPEAHRESVSSAWSGVKFGKDNCFTLQKLRYQGGMGEIWAAWMNDPRTSRRVAIKIIRPEVISKLSRELFEREIEMHRRVADVHGVLPLVDSGKFTVPTTGKEVGDIGSGSEVRYLATEWISNVRSLDQACKDLSWEARINLFVRICETLDVIHKRAIVHCDLKPHNILIDEQGNPLIADFGLAISNLPTDRETTGLDIGSVRGTWSYMAPEQCAEQCDPYGYKASLDVYALGVTFYECLTGSLPYPKDPGKASHRTEAARIINEQLHIAMRHKGRTLPPQMYAALSKACSNNPSMRFADAGKLANALRTSHSVVRVKEVGYCLGTLLSIYLLFWTLFYFLTYNYPVYDLFRQAMLQIAPVTTSIDHVAILETNVEVENKIDTLAGLNGLGAKTSRAAYSAILDKLAQQGVRAVAIDTWFTSPGIPEANAMFLNAVKNFEDDHNGTVIIAKQDWIDLRADGKQVTQTQVKRPPSDPPSEQGQSNQSVAQVHAAGAENGGVNSERFPICDQLNALSENLGSVVIGVDRFTNFLESELVYRGSNDWSEASFPLLSAIAYKYSNRPVYSNVNWRNYENTFSVSLKSRLDDDPIDPLEFELSSIQTGQAINDNLKPGSPARLRSNDSVGFFNVGRLPDDDAFQNITIPADILWDEQQSKKPKGMDLSNRLVLIVYNEGVKEFLQEQTEKKQLKDDSDETNSQSDTQGQNEKETTNVEMPPDMIPVGDRYVPGYNIQALLIDSLIKYKSPTGSGALTRMIPFRLVSLNTEAALSLFFSAFMLAASWWSCSQPSITHRTRFLITVALIVTGLCLLTCIALFLGMGIVFSPFNLLLAMLFSAFAGSLIPWMTPTPRRRNAEKAAAAS